MIVETDSRGMAYFCLIGLYSIFGSGIITFLEDRLYVAALVIIFMCMILAGIFYVALRKLIITQEGITVKFAFYQKIYKWDMFSIKRMERCINGVESAFFSLKQVKATAKLHKSQIMHLSTQDFSRHMYFLLIP